jgi:hypothetical protein
MTKQELFEQISNFYKEFESAHNSTKKKDAAIARKAAGAIKKLITPYNQASVSEAKVVKSSN